MLQAEASWLCVKYFWHRRIIIESCKFSEVFERVPQNNQLQHSGHQSDIKLHTATHLGTIYSYTKSFAYSQFCWPPGFKQTLKKHKKKPLWYLCVLMHFHLLQFPNFAAEAGRFEVWKHEFCPTLNVCLQAIFVPDDAKVIVSYRLSLSYCICHCMLIQMLHSINL